MDAGAFPPCEGHLIVQGDFGAEGIAMKCGKDILEPDSIAFAPGTGAPTAVLTHGDRD